jgi:CheY-like chemotaxis protein
MDQLPHILIVDDEPFNIEIVTEILKEHGGYRISTAEDGDVALKMMEATPEDFDIVLLDRMMPKMSGMEVLLTMKQHDVLRHCPVIFQTAKTSTKDITVGLEAGAHYYLSKPFDEKLLLSVVKTVVYDYFRYKFMRESLDTNKGLMKLLKEVDFEFRTIEEAQSLAALLSNACPDPQKVVMGLSELMINAIEHGNLGITYQEKTIFNNLGVWVEEVEKRLNLPEYSERYASINFKVNRDDITIKIKDQGNGFDWQVYMDFDANRVVDNHGRGIAIANKISFSSVVYRGNGNEVTASLLLA